MCYSECLLHQLILFYFSFSRSCLDLIMHNRSIGLALTNESWGDLTLAEWPVSGESWEHHCDFSHGCTQNVCILTSGVNICLLRSKHDHNCPQERSIFTMLSCERTGIDDLQSLVQYFLPYFISSCCRPCFGAQGLGLQLSQVTTYQQKMPGCTVLALKNRNLGYDFTRNWITLVDHYSQRDLSYSLPIYYSLLLLPFFYPVPCLTTPIKHVPEKTQHHWVDIKPSTSFYKGIFLQC